MTDYDGDLVRLLGDERASDAARARSRERDLRLSVLTDATLAGVLLDIAERREPVSVRTAFGRTLRGQVSVVAQDGILLETTVGTSYVRFDGIASFRGSGSRAIAEPSGARNPPRAGTNSWTSPT